MHFLGIDIETTGLDFNLMEVHQIALVKVDFTINPNDGLPSFGCSEGLELKPRVVDPSKVSQSALEVCKVSMAEITDPSRMSFKDCMDQLYAYVVTHFDNQPIYFGHNVKFDIKSLFQIEKRHGRKWPLPIPKLTSELEYGYGYYDSMELADFWRSHTNRYSSKSLDSMCAVFNLNINRETHDAVADIWASAWVARCILAELKGVELPKMFTTPQVSDLKLS